MFIQLKFVFKTDMRRLENSLKTAPGEGVARLAVLLPLENACIFK